MKGDLLTTGQAARICSVSPEAVLRWIKSGRLRAFRTPGGHHRIPSEELERHQGLQLKRKFCWEYNGRGAELLDACRQCIVYRSRTQRCWELARLGASAGHSLSFCRSDCESCDYYRVMQGRVAHVLVFSDDPQLTDGLRRETAPPDLDLEIAESEYALSALVGLFRPEFVVIDGAIGSGRIRRIAASVVKDRRARLEGIILAAAEEDELAKEHGEEWFARMPRPFRIEHIAECIARTRAKFSNHG
ncbi:MAG: MerR family transcriptional regulator [Planctomycetota bacterium]|jgi:excisionase family DNA binding protein